MARLSETRVRARLRVLRGWSLARGALQRKATLTSFNDAIALVNRVALVAEEMNHHPDMGIRWSTVTFRISSHDLQAITERDFELAHRIEALLAQPAPSAHAHAASA